VYNLTAPKPTTNKGLTQALSAALRKPAFLQIPRFVLRLQFGEGAQVLIQGQNVLPKRLLDSGFQFKFSDIESAVKDCVVP
jgi:NAD dependent epimerase/dehydratase family enzyme